MISCLNAFGVSRKMSTLLIHSLSNDNLIAKRYKSLKTFARESSHESHHYNTNIMLNRKVFKSIHSQYPWIWKHLTLIMVRNMTESAKSKTFLQHRYSLKAHMHFLVFRKGEIILKKQKQRHPKDKRITFMPTVLAIKIWKVLCHISNVSSYCAF